MIPACCGPNPHPNPNPNPCSMPFVVWGRVGSYGNGQVQSVAHHRLARASAAPCTRLQDVHASTHTHTHIRARALPPALVGAGAGGGAPEFVAYYNHKRVETSRTATSSVHCGSKGKSVKHTLSFFSRQNQEAASR
jgi:hypothetical protein